MKVLLMCLSFYFLVATIKNLISAYMNKVKLDKKREIDEILRRNLQDNPIPTGINAGVFGSDLLNPFRYTRQNQYQFMGQMGQEQYQYTPDVNPIEFQIQMSQMSKEYWKRNRSGFRKEKVINPTLELPKPEEKE